MVIYLFFLFTINMDTKMIFYNDRNFNNVVFAVYLNRTKLHTIYKYLNSAFYKVSTL